MKKRKKHLLNSKEFLHAYLAMERPTTSHLYFTKGILDFLVGIVVGIVIGIIVAIYI